MRRLALAVLSSLTLGAARAPAVIGYAVSPDSRDGRLQALTVEATVPLRRGEAATFVAPRLIRGDPIQALKVQGGALQRRPDGTLELRSTNGLVRVSYRIQAETSDGLEVGRQAPVVRGAWFSVRGEDLLPSVRGAGDRRARLELRGFPKGWTAASSLEGAVPESVVADSLVVGGRAYALASHDQAGMRLRIAYPREDAAKAQALLAQAASILAAEDRLWRAPPHPFLIVLMRDSDGGDFSGRGAEGGFALWLGAEAPRNEWLHLVAHENLHHWISRAIGGFPTVDDDLEAWLNEGFTEAYAARVLLEAGLWTPQEFVADWNGSLARYGLSPVRDAPNTRIQADRGRDFDVNKLPYDRGRLLALRWDAQFRARTGGRVGLEEVLRDQIKAAAANARAGRRISADQLFPQVARRMTGVDLSSDIARFVDRGEPLRVAPGAFGDCVRVVEVTQPVFDRGFDLTATLKAGGHLVGLEPDGPAERAGLREGDRIRVDEIPSHDSRVSLTYRVDQPDGSRRAISYRPLGRALVSFQQLELDPAGPACRRALLRP